MSFWPQSPAPAASAEYPARRAAWWQLRTRRLRLPARPVLMGILNVTPDSFSDGGKFVDANAAIEHAVALAADGADIIDIGGESTRPGSAVVPAQEELDRVIPVITALAARLATPLSIDTSKAEVARAAIAAGAEIINDVTALAADAGMLQVARESRAGVCVMHMQGTPQTMQDDPTYEDVVAEVFEFLRSRRDALVDGGISQDRIALDPGIGFGKTHTHNLTLLTHCYRLHALECPLLVGHSRKSFINKVLGDKEADPTAGTIGVSLALARQGVQILRAHDVAAVRQALVLFEAVGDGGDSMDASK